MNQNIMNLFSQKSPMEDFFMVMMSPDEDFDKNYEALLKSINLSSTSKVQQNILANISDVPVDDEKIEREELEKMLAEIDADNELSENKKTVLKTFLRNIGELSIDLRKNPRERIGVKIFKINENAKIPTYANPSDAGADIYAAEDITLEPNSTTLVSTGIKADIPAGYALFIYPRSGMSFKTKVRVANSVGVIDHLYHEEIKVIMDNNSNEPYTIKTGDRIAQMIIMPVPMIKFEETKEDLSNNGRSGFGSTGQ